MNTKLQPYTIKIFYPDGDPRGICIIEKINWTGLGVIFRRSCFDDVLKRKEISSPGCIY